jgi:hypothetical protein
MIKTHDITGFTAYWIYVAVKSIHFGAGKYDITHQRLPQKARFIKAWNDGRKDRDGMIFLKVMEKMSSKKEDYIRLFAAYYMKKPSFHVSDILNDNFHTYKQNEIELNDILATVKSDYLAAILYCNEKEMLPETMFYGNHGLPLIYKMFNRGKISVNSIIAFDEVFGIAKGLDWYCKNIVEEADIKLYKQIFVKYRPIVYNYFKDIAWKKEIQDYHHYIMKYGR